MARVSGRDRKPAAELTWTALNDFLRDASEDECAVLLAEERAGRARKLVLERVVCRYLRMKNQRERRELLRRT